MALISLDVNPDDAMAGVRGFLYRMDRVYDSFEERTQRICVRKLDISHPSGKIKFHAATTFENSLEYPKKIGEQRAKAVDFLAMDEGRKRVLLIAAAILATRKLAAWDGRPSPAVECAVTDSIALAERILSKIDSKWPKRDAA